MPTRDRDIAQEEIAEHLARGKQQQWISEQLGLSHTVVLRRLETMRAVLVEEHPDGGRWLNKAQRSPVEVALAWLERDAGAGV